MVVAEMREAERPAQAEPDAVSVGFVLELDNIRYADRARADQMIEQLVRQVGRLSNRLEAPAPLIIVFDPEALAEDDVRTFLAKHELGRHPFLDVQLRPQAGLGYYAQKNFGMRLIQRDVIVMVDSDIVVNDDWLENLLSAFDDPAVEIAYGDVELETDTFFEKAYALATPAFALDGVRAPREQVDAFLANNVAFRRRAVEGDLFPPSEAYRGHCRLASDRIRARGGRIHRINAARGRHPAPNGLRHFLLRALVEGHDEVVLTRQGDAAAWKKTIIGSGARLARSLVRSAARVAKHGKAVGLHPVQAPAAFAVAALYFGLRFAGEVATHIHPRLIRDHGIH
jgi:glycosyltransferase involved in cell wall biosynthesis